jgi:hypothetical protein
MAESPRHFPSPWRADPMPGGYVVRDAIGQALAYIYSRDNEDEARQARVLTKDRAADRYQRRATSGAAREGGSRLSAEADYWPKKGSRLC